MRRLILIPLIALFGCNVQKRQIEKLQVFALRYPNEFARLSDLLNPCFDGEVKSDTIISTHTDTLLVDGVTTTVRVKDTVFVTKTLPGKTITNTRTVTIKDTVKDGRAISYLNSQLKVKSDSLVIVKTQMSQVKKTKNILMWILIGIAVVVVAYGAIKIYKFFSGGALKSLIK